MKVNFCVGLDIMHLFIIMFIALKKFVFYTFMLKYKKILVIQKQMVSQRQDDKMGHINARVS